MERNGRIGAVTESFSFLLLFAACASIQILIGGTRMVFSLPAYGLLGVAGVCALFLWRRVQPAPSQLCLAATSIFLGYVLGRALLSPAHYIARSDVHSVLAGLVVYFLVACILTGARQRMTLVVLLLAVALGHVLVGAVQFRDGSNFMPISWLQRYDYERRASGFYVCPNHLAGLLEVLGVMGLSIACWSRWPVWGKLVVGYAVAVCYVGLILTGSRGGYLSAATGLFVFALLSVVVLRRVEGRVFWSIGALGAITAVVVSLTIVFYVSKSDFLKGRAQNTFETSNMRIDLWKGALQQWKLAPLFGTGSATYLYYGRFFRTEQMQQDPVYAHNDYLQLLAEYGILGLVGMAGFLALHLRHSLRNFARLGPRRVVASQLLSSNALALNMGAFAAVASYVVHSIFDFNLHIPANVLLLAFVFALLANDGVVRGREPSITPVSQKLWRVAPALLAVILLVQCARLLPGEYFSERARMALRDGQPGQALLYARRGLQYDGSNPDLHYRLGTARLQFGGTAVDRTVATSFRRAAIEALERARALAPRELIYGLELAGAFDAGGEFEEAERVFQDLLQHDPRSASLHRYHEAHLKLWHEGPGPAAEAAEIKP